MIEGSDSMKEEEFLVLYFVLYVMDRQMDHYQKSLNLPMWEDYFD